MDRPPTLAWTSSPPAGVLLRQLATDRGFTTPAYFTPVVRLDQLHNPLMPAPSGMPSRLSNFVGRKKELAELRRLLPHTRLLTLLGPGGSGKTRLAMEFVRRQESRFAGGVAFAELADITDAALIVKAIARASGVKLEGRDHPASLIRGLESYRVVVIDNCEHLVEHAAQVATDLLIGCPQLTLIATSRERMNVEAEHIYLVPPLGVPAGGMAVATADSSDAVRLFIARAGSVRPGFVVTTSNAVAVLTICRRLEGMPLAIELAAARLTTLSPHDIVPRLEDSLRLLTRGSRGGASRQQTLRATIDWSYQLLADSEQRLLTRMSVFAGSVDAAAVEEVCAFPPLERNDVLDALSRLVEKSMVQIEGGHDRMRYRLLETIREYSAEKLVAEGDDAGARDRHRARYRRLIDEAYEARRHRGAVAEHRVLWQEMNDVRAALEWARRDPEVEQEMLGGLYLVWMVNAPREGFERINDALRRVAPNPSKGFLRAGHAWDALGGITGLRWDGTPIDVRLIELVGKSDDKFFQGAMHMGLGYVAERQLRDMERAHSHMVAGVEMYTTLGPGPQLAMAMGSLGSVEVRLGRPDVGRDWIEKAVAMALEIDDQYGAVGAYFHLGYLELDFGTREKALAAFLAGLELVERGDTLSTTDQVAGIGCAIADTDPRYALRLLSAAARLRTPLALSVATQPLRPRVDSAVQEARSALSEKESDAAWASGGGLTVDALQAEVREHFRSRSGMQQRPARGLSRREVENARLVAAGMTSRAIADKLFLSERTVETHLTNIMTKLGFSSRAQVDAWIAEQGRASGPEG